MNIVKQGKQIAEGWINDAIGRNVDIGEERMQICKSCPLFKTTFGGQCNPKLWLDPDTGGVSTKSRDGYYKGCGCALLKKTKVRYAHCPAHKW